MATVPTEVSELGFTGDGVNDTFPLTFPILEAAHLVVSLLLEGETEETLQVLGVDYTVSAAPSDAPVVTMLTPPSTGDTLTIKRTVPITQETNYITGGAYSPSSFTRNFDYRTMVEQQLARRIAYLEALASLVSIADFNAQVVDLSFTANAVDVENTFPLTLAVVAPVGGSIIGVQVVKVEILSADDGLGLREAVQVTRWSWDADILTIDFITGLVAGVSYDINLLCLNR